MAASTNTDLKCEACIYTLTDFLLLSMHEEKLTNFIYSHGLLPKNKNCPVCQHPMKLIEDARVFRCHRYTRVKNNHKKSVAKYCNKRISQYKNTCFQSHKLSMVTVCRLVAYWVLLRPPRKDFIQAEINVATHTIINWCHYLREVCTWYMLKESCTIGGTGKTVELQEAKIGKRWYNKGSIINGNWVFGGFERDSGKYFLTPVADRSPETLLSIIQTNILPGTIIISDCWKAYSCLEREEYKHLKDNFSYKFLDPESGEHNPRFTRFWREVRGNIPRYGNKKHHMVGHLAEFLFKRKYKDHTSRIHYIFKAIGELYNSENEIIEVPNKGDTEDSDSDIDNLIW